jgi:hypothetical protein
VYSQCSRLRPRIIGCELSETDGIDQRAVLVTGTTVIDHNAGTSDKINNNSLHVCVPCCTINTNSCAPKKNPVNNITRLRAVFGKSK